MRRALIYPLLAARLFAATYYVSSAGSDSNDGSADNPWLTLQHAVSSVACGDTIDIVANGSYVAGDANLPYFPNCGLTTTVQSSAWAQFEPDGFRTNPATDCASSGTCLYGKLQFTNQGIDVMPEAHGSSSDNGNGVQCGISTLVSNTITLGCYNAMPNLANGSQVEFEVNNQGFPTAYAVPSGLTILQHYYVINCTGTCGATGSTFQVSATSGGSAIPITCAGGCIPGAVLITEPLQFTAGSATITSPDAISYVAGQPVALAAAGLQQFGTLPAPFSLDTLYYVLSPSGQTFQLAATPGGSAIVATSVGVGPSNIANADLPHHWRFLGLELVEKPGSVIYNLFQLGSGQETSVVSMVNHMEVSHCWLHDNPSDASGPNRGIADNGTFVYAHDNYIAGMRLSESQAISGWGSPGPTAIVNNFLEASAENTLYGGNPTNSGVANANKTIAGNYYYKPPVWKVSANTGVPTGACWYDATDPGHAGGEWYTNTSVPQVYQCGSDFAWHTSAGTPPAFTIKNMAEIKNGRHFTYEGNSFNYVWASSQSGQVFNTNQGTGPPGVALDHITVQNNKATNAYQFVVTGSLCDEPSPSTIGVPCIYYPSNYVYQNNLVTISLNACGVTFTTGSQTCGYFMFLTDWGGYPADSMFFNHNTIYTGDTWSGLYPQGPQAQWMNASNLLGGTNGQVTNWTLKNSIWSGDFNGQATPGSCPNVLQCYYTNSTWTNNVLLNGTSSRYTSPGTGNTFAHAAYPASNAMIGYVNPAAGDYHLSSFSPYSAQNGSATLLSDDGTDLGADIDLVNMATSGAAPGTPSWDRQAGLRVDAGSSQVVFRYTAPTPDTCAATIYRAPARIPGNQVASEADDSANSISDALTRELYVPGLQPSTPYWYKLACGGGVLLVGNLLTRAPGQGSVSFTFDWSSPTAMQYSSSPSMSDPVSLPAATRQIIPVAADSVVYVQEGASGPITMLIAP